MTVNLYTGEQRAPRPEDYTTKATAVSPGGDCPLWHAFLDRVTDGDVSLQDYLQRVCGYCLTGLTREHVLFFLFGTGANGKSVFVNTVAGMMGDYAVVAGMETFLSSRGERHPTELAMLRGARLVVATETEADRRWSEAKLKALTGGDRITARFMRQDFFTFQPKFTLMLSGNHKPSLRSVDEAIRRRMHLIPFTVTIPPEERDVDLADKLKSEWPGILQWAVDGCIDYQARGLEPPAAVTDATAAYIAEEDSFTQWIDECLERAGDFAFERTADLYASWKTWAERAGEQPSTMKAFSQNMQARGYVVKRQGHTKARGFEGVRINRPDYSDDPRYPDR